MDDFLLAWSSIKCVCLIPPFSCSAPETGTPHALTRALQDEFYVQDIDSLAKVAVRGQLCPNFDVPEAIDWQALMHTVDTHLAAGNVSVLKSLSNVVIF